MKQLVWAFMLTLVAGASHAAGAIYRCGPDGRTFSQTPCDGGQLVDAADPRTAAQRAEARRMQTAERKAAQDLERERQAAEKPRPALASLGPSPAASAPAREGSRSSKAKGKGKGKVKGEPEDDKDFVAVEPNAKKKSSRGQ